MSTRMRRRQLCFAAAAAALSHAFRLPPAPTIGTALRAATAAFNDQSIPEAELSAEHLLTRAAGFGNDRGALSWNKQEPLSPEAQADFERMCAQRLERTPVQYILGDWDFLDLTLAMRPPVLIPRPETEELVDHVLKSHGASTESSSGRASTFLDVGCGTGAIGLALLHGMRSSTCVAIDLSADAVALATENAERCGLADRYTALLVAGGIAEYGSAVASSPDSNQSDGAGARSGSGGNGCYRGGKGAFDVIVSNPPYIPRADMSTLEAEVVGHEDDRALCGGEDGLDVVRELLLSAPSLLRPDGPKTIWLEVDPSHPPLIRDWLASEPQASELRMEFVQWFSDGYGLPRFCQVRWHGPRV